MHHCKKDENMDILDDSLDILPLYLTEDTIYHFKLYYVICTTKSNEES
jgi:hypothetical protein